MLECKSAEQEICILMESVILNNICFPKVYEDFSSLPFRQMYLCADEFPGHLTHIAGSTCLIIDALVERGVLGDDWEELFRNMTNKMAEDVLYDPSKIDFTVKEKSQEKFIRLLHAPVYFNTQPIKLLI